MFAFIITLHVIVSIFLIFVILLQPGKGDAMGSLGGGGGGANTVFGGRGSVTFLTLAWRSSHSASVLAARRHIAAEEKAAKKDEKPLAPPGQTAPAPAPAAPAPAKEK